MSLMMDSESSVGGTDENLFLERYHVGRIPFLIGYNRIEVDVFRSCGRIDDLAASKVIV
jgi:hypothetical protein